MYRSLKLRDAYGLDDLSCGDEPKSRSGWRLLAKERIFTFMGMLTNLMSKIFGPAPAATSSPVAPPSTTIESATAPSPTSPVASAVSPATAAPAVSPTQTVDVTAILDGLAAKNPQKLDWRKSIVDLMTLIDMDSSLSARKELATELHYSGNKNDSASMNMWLHKEVMGIRYLLLCEGSDSMSYFRNRKPNKKPMPRAIKTALLGLSRTKASPFSLPTFRLRTRIRPGTFRGASKLLIPESQPEQYPAILNATAVTRFIACN
jgi:hypothetical protein